jgi:hypothetical protein
MKKPNVLSTQVGGDHYAKYPIQPVEYIQANRLDFAQGNIVKLATRFRDKGGAEDLRKIKQYAEILLALEYGQDTPAAQPIATEPQDGIYVVYDNGRAELFTGSNAKEGVKYVGVVFQGHHFGVALTETEIPLLPEDKEAAKREDFYKTECEAIYDFDSTGNTERLLRDNPKLADYLNEGEAIPALGVVVIMYLLRKSISGALAYVGGQPLGDKGYWSSTECNETYAWGVNFASGLTWNYDKCYGYALRAVAAF